MNNDWQKTGEERTYAGKMIKGRSAANNGLSDILTIWHIDPAAMAE